MQTTWKYKGYHIFREYPKGYRIVSYAGDFKPKKVKTMAEAKKFINKILKA